MKNILVKTAVTAVCLYTAAKWAKKHIRAGVIIGSPNIASAEIKELIEKRMRENGRKNDGLSDWNSPLL